MPIYEYQCDACHHTFDVLQKISDEPLKRCPKCEQDRVKKLVSAAGFQLKGTGWYVTDFKDSGKKTAKTAETTDTTKTAKTSDATSSESASSGSGSTVAGSTD